MMLKANNTELQTNVTQKLLVCAKYFIYQVSFKTNNWVLKKKLNAVIKLWLTALFDNCRNNEIENKILVVILRI